MRRTGSVVERVERTVAQRGGVEPPGRVLAMVSGGADSTLLVAVLAELGLDEERRSHIIEVWNKVDLLPAEEQGLTRARAIRHGEVHGTPAVAVSAWTGEGIEDLRERIAELIDDAPEVDVLLGAGEGAAIAWLYRNGRIVTREDGEEGAVRLRVKLDSQALGRFERLFPEATMRAAAQ